MKTSIRIALITIIIVILGSVMVFAGEPIKLQLDGRFVETDVPPIIENGRTLVPYRALLESMGAEVFTPGPMRRSKRSREATLQLRNTTGSTNWNRLTEK